MTVDPFLIISVKDIGFVGIELGVKVEIGVGIGAVPAIFCIWADI
jgi:hypothetical protein